MSVLPHVCVSLNCLERSTARHQALKAAKAALFGVVIAKRERVEQLSVIIRSESFTWFAKRQS